MSEQQRTTRRGFLTSVAALSAGGGLVPRAHPAEPVRTPSSAVATLIDTHVYFGDWPHADIPAAQPRALAELLRASSVSQAWVGSFEGLFHKDIAGVNERLADTCAGQAQGLLVPFGTVNPTLPDWEDDIRRCAESWKMPGVRLHPNYHGYALDAPRFANLLTQASERDLLVQLVVKLDDQPRKWLSPHLKQVDLTPLPSVAAKIANLRLLVSGTADIGSALLGELAKSISIYFELPQTDASAIAKILDHIPARRLVYGSAAPLYSIAAAVLKPNEANVDHSVQQSIAAANAKQLLQDSN